MKEMIDKKGDSDQMLSLYRDLKEQITAVQSYQSVINIEEKSNSLNINPEIKNGVLKPIRDDDLRNIVRKNIDTEQKNLNKKTVDNSELIYKEKKTPFKKARESNNDEDPNHDSSMSLYKNYIKQKKSYLENTEQPKSNITIIGKHPRNNKNPIKSKTTHSSVNMPY